MTNRHGSPRDRGSADAYYHRPFDPHYYVGASYTTPRVEAAQMTADELAEYTDGYYGETDRKEWGDSAPDPDDVDPEVTFDRM